ncbi:13362_t:CDS:2, partial [Cetraspora pellucida]
AIVIMEEYGIPGSSSSTPAGHNHYGYVNKNSSTSSTFIINKTNTKVEDQTIIDHAKEFMKDFKNPSNLISFKYLVEDLEVEPSASLLELLVDALLLL